MASKFQRDNSVVLKVQQVLALEPAGKDVQVLQGESQSLASLYNRNLMQTQWSQER